MAENNEDIQQLIVVDPLKNTETHENLHFPKNVKLYIKTGNIATWSSLKTRKTQIPANEVCR